MRCEVEHLKEFRTLEECEHTREHKSLDELDVQAQRAEIQSHAEFVKLSRWTRSVQPRLVITDERRQYRALKSTKGDWGSVAVGIEPPRVELGEVRRLHKGVHVMPDGRGVRLSCAKWERLCPPSKRSKSRRADPAGLAAVLKELGIA